MPITRVLRSIFPRVGLSVCLTAMLLAPTSACSQDTQSLASAPLPKDAKALLLLAAKSNRLDDPAMHPWHFKVAYSLIGESGNATNQGEIEEWWQAGRSRIAYSSANFSQVLYVTGKGMFRSGAQTAAPNLLQKLEDQLTNPIQINEKQIDQFILEKEKREQAGVKLICIKQTGFETPSGVHNFPGPAYCLSADKPILQGSVLNLPDPVQFLRTGIRVFQDRYIPTDIVATENGKPVMRAHVDALEELNTVDEATFTPSQDAQPVHLRINISAGVAAGMIDHKTAPVYPPEAQAAGISGTVALQALIGKDGHVIDLRVISGPPELQQSALDAVRTWVYRPYFLNGTPVEVNTSINVVFALNR